MLSVFGMLSRSVIGTRFLDWLIRESGHRIWHLGPVVANRSIVDAMVDKPASLDGFVPCRGQLLGAVESKHFHQLRVPESHWPLIPGCIFGVRNVGHKTNGMVADVLGGAAFEKQPGQFVRPM
ncbi:hypothetical protein [Rubripirellula lacrimiformis]|uniref:hypothetical protein n=1 Tax=Rubripirellula lacrimiformis TaxID=1930273 RepID=UPI001C54CBB0|nr:hypothetical protein [Rubripirellula lacrimiformis]